MIQAEKDPSDALRVYAIGNACIDMHRQEDGTTVRSFGGSALNTAVQINRLMGPEVVIGLVSAVGQRADGTPDANARDILEYLVEEGIDTSGIEAIPGADTLVYQQANVAGASDVVLTKPTARVATDVHTPEMVQKTLAHTKLGGAVVYLAGVTRKLGFMDKPDELEALLEQLARHGATTILDPGRAPEAADKSRLARAQSLVRSGTIHFPAMNELEFSGYFGAELDNNTVTHAGIDALVSKEVFRPGSNAVLFSITLGHKGIYLASCDGGTLRSAFINDVPPLARHQRLTTVGLGDSTKAGMIAAMHDIVGGPLRPDTLSGLTVEELQQVGLAGLATSTYRMSHNQFGTRSAINAMVKNEQASFFERHTRPDRVSVA